MKLKRVCSLLLSCFINFILVSSNYAQEVNMGPSPQATTIEKTGPSLKTQKMLELQLQWKDKKIVKLQTCLYVSLILLFIVSCSALFFLKRNKRKIIALKTETVFNEKQRSFKKTTSAIPVLSKLALQEDTATIKSVKDELVFKLSKTHPALTDKDHQLCTLLMLNLSSKEIAGVLNIQEESVEKSRSRLRKKMNLDSGQNFIEYFNSIK